MCVGGGGINSVVEKSSELFTDSVATYTCIKSCLFAVDIFLLWTDASFSCWHSEVKIVLFEKCT